MTNAYYNNTTPTLIVYVCLPDWIELAHILILPASDNQDADYSECIVNVNSWETMYVLNLFHSEGWIENILICVESALILQCV